MEGIRLYNWDQLTASNWIPGNFTNYYYPLASPENRAHPLSRHGSDQPCHFESAFQLQLQHAGRRCHRQLDERQCSAQPDDDHVCGPQRRAELRLRSINN